ncbi:MAG: TIGR01777 family oxidoreductase [Fimbriimonadaceae bacterium]|nr:TIGR01777 family oxidoreductase [Fimbriimonadaceae bacterium]
MKVVLAGGSGQVGAVLRRALKPRGAEVVVLTREATPDTMQWDGKALGPWADAVDGADVVINLAGRSVNCRYTPENRRAILDSRVDSTRVIGQAIAQAESPPAVWLQASTATIYRHRYDAPNDDVTGELGGNEPGAPDTWNFSIDVAKAWEQTLAEAPTSHTRKVAMRSALTLSPDRGGVFDVLLGLVRKGLGGAMGDGRQYVSWIHEADFGAAVLFLIDHEELEGPVALASPNPIPNSEFMHVLREAWGARFGLPAPAWMIEIGTRLMGTESELVLKSRRVLPTRLLRAGFEFQFPEWPAAAADLCARVRDASRPDTR